MDLPKLQHRTPFGIAMLHLPDYIREGLLDFDILPTQSEGELFLQLCLQLVPQDHPSAMDGRQWVKHVVQSEAIDPSNPAEASSTWVATTQWMETFVEACAAKVSDQVDPAIRAVVQDVCFTLWTAAAKGTDSALMSDLHIRQEAQDRATWRAFHQRPAVLEAVAAKWRHWKPRHLKEESHTTQRKLEQHLRSRWAERVINLLEPYANEVPYMRAIGTGNLNQEYLDLLGDTRFRTLRIHCLCLENLRKLGFTNIPWTEGDVRNLLNTLRTQEVTPHKLQSIWNTLRWFSAKFGLLNLDSVERLKAKRKTIQESLVDTMVKPQRKAQLPSKAVIMALEQIAGGTSAVALGTGRTSPKHLLDRYITAMARFQVACSARFNDLQHTSPSGYKSSDKSIELSAWQTKTTNAFQIKQKPVPLIAPLYSFSGVDWWTALTTTWDRLTVNDKFKDMDYLIPTVSSDFTGLIPRPSQADRALRWLKDALHRSGLVPLEDFKDLSWHSFRVFIPDCAYQLGMPRDQRQYLGNWSAESTADIYTREKRKVVQKTWTAVAERLGNLDLRGSKQVPIDLDHEHWKPDVLDLDSAPSDSTASPTRKSRRLESGGTPDSWEKMTPPKGLEDDPSMDHGYRVVSATKPSRAAKLMTIHLLDKEGRAIGCGWQPGATKALDLNPEDYQHTPGAYAKCARCFNKHDFPTGWNCHPPDEEAQPSDDSDALSSDLFTDESVDTASDDDKLTAEAL